MTNYREILRLSSLQYSQRTIESIYYGEILLAQHQLQYHTGKIVWLPGQYKGLAERKGIAAPYPAAHQQDVRVEVRSLHFYDSLLGGAAHG